MTAPASSTVHMMTCNGIVQDSEDAAMDQSISTPRARNVLEETRTACVARSDPPRGPRELRDFGAMEQAWRLMHRRGDARTFR